MIASIVPSALPIGITGLGAYAPEQVLTSDDVGRAVDVSGEWINARTGIRERRIAEPGQAASDLAAPAARAALEQAGADPSSIELVIVATASPDMLFPATASLVATEIGAHRAAAFDLSAACTGFVYAVAQAYASVASGLAERVLVVGSEVLSRFMSWRDRSTCILFADAAGAAVVEHVSDGGFLGFELGSDGSGAGDILLPAGGSRAPATMDTVGQELHAIQMNGKEVFRFSIRAGAESAKKLLACCGLGIDDVDHYAPHQSNRRIIDQTARRLGLPHEKVLLNIDRYGNTSAASIPLVLAEAVETGRLRAGDTVLMTGVGAGLTWGSALVRWSVTGGCR